MSAESQAENRPIIIIRRKKVMNEDDHHGGAWKVAYADFVTAMMAFFLLMWLLNATTEEQRKGLADYFNPTIPISRISGGGSDGLNGSSIFTEETYAKMGTGASRSRSIDRPSDDGDDSSANHIAAELKTLQDALSEQGKALSEHLHIKMTSDGIVLDIADSESDPLFEIGSSTPSPVMNLLLETVAATFRSFTNDIAIVGHTDSRQYSLTAGYDNWDLSTARANAARRILLAHGLEIVRIVSVEGKADTDPLVTSDRNAAQNRRISITIRTKDRGQIPG